MRKNGYFLFICLLGVVLIVTCPFLIGKVEGNTALILYVISKISFGLIFIGTAAYCFFKKVANGLSFTLMAVASIFQFVPLLVRYLSKLQTNATLWTIIALCLSLMAFLAIFGATLTMNKKMVEADETYKGNEIPLK